jgi:outer membrane protein assembly factor BamD
MKKYYLLIIFTLAALSGCSTLNTDPIPDPEESWNVERIYSEATKALENEDYTKAIKYFDLIESRFPFGEYAQQSLIDSAYTHYEAGEPEKALATIDRFIRVYPLNPKLDYAIYLRGLINFTRDVGIIEKYIPRDETQRDPGSAQFALQDFTNLINRYPSSQYSKDASQRIVYLRNRLAQHEINVAHFYLRRGAYVAALNRGKYVIENYQRTPAMPEALVVTARAYKILGLQELSDDTIRVLEFNYPQYPGLDSLREIILE